MSDRFSLDEKKKLKFAEGRWFVNVCPDCKESNGMGVVNEQHLIEHYESDPYDPCNKPCLWCGKGPMVRHFLDPRKTSENLFRGVI